MRLEVMDDLFAVTVLFRSILMSASKPHPHRKAKLLNYID